MSSTRDVFKLGEYIIKAPKIRRVIPKFETHLDLLDFKERLTMTEFLGLSQMFFEKAVWEECNWDEKRLLCPIIDFRYDNNNIPIFIMPYIEPLLTLEEALETDQDDCLDIINNILIRNGKDEEQVGQLFEDILTLCENHGINDEDILYNLSNCGFSNTLGFRILDYGLSIDDFQIL